MEFINSPPSISQNSSLENCNTFRRVAMKISDLGASVGIKISPFHHPSLIFFSKLDDLNQRKVLEALNTYLNIYESVKSEGVSILNCSRVIWNALLQLGYRPTSDLFSHISDEHLIEVHDCNLIQVFRNLSFFNYCSYSLEELYCHQLVELYERDLKTEQNLMSLAPPLFSGEIRNVIDPNLQPHIIQEKISSAKLAVLCHVQKIAPLFSSASNNPNPIAVLTIEKAEIAHVPTVQAEIIQLSSLRANATETQL